ncbi:MAG TPA: outer membrane protein assembly factor BamD [Candidatus Acidoferrum sp.]|nr:outer membrane protein assembly factor BamD [Candidatus Acidoferrum sp.]
MKRALSIAVVILAAGLSPACSGNATGKVNYAVTAQQNYERGVKEMKEEDWVAAAKYFSFIKARFPYSKYAVLAELRLADAEFGAEHYLQAIDAFKQFVKFHPSHEMVRNGYASFRIAGSYYQMLPDDLWILPPSFEKDQSGTSDAHRELTEFLRKYPTSPQLKKARALLARINLRLAEHEMYVAKFYWSRGQPMGTVLRLRRLLDKHGGVGYDPEALYLLGKAYVEIKEPRRAREAWERLVKQYPKDGHAADARAQLRRLPAG